MLKAATVTRQPRQGAARFDVEIAGVATAVPEHKVSQADIAERAKAVFPHLARHEGLYANTGISDRYFCQAADWYREHHGWEERTEIFQRHALSLLEQVTLASVAAAGISLDDIGALVVNTITGLAIPSLDAKLMNRLKLPASVARLPIFGLGCGGGVAGLARAARFAQAMPGGHVLFLTVDLCSLCLRVADPSMAMFVSAALFGDGAAGIVLRNTEGSNGAGAAAASSPWAIISGPTPSTSWAGTSNRTALGWCSARNFPRCCVRNWFRRCAASSRRTASASASSAASCCIPAAPRS